MMRSISAPIPTLQMGSVLTGSANKSTSRSTGNQPTVFDNNYNNSMMIYILYIKQKCKSSAGSSVSSLRILEVFCSCRCVCTEGLKRSYFTAYMRTHMRTPTQTSSFGFSCDCLLPNAPGVNTLLCFLMDRKVAGSVFLDIPEE